MPSVEDIVLPAASDDPVALDVQIHSPADARAPVAFEFTACGDRVPARVWLPEATPAGPCSLVVLQTAFGAAIDADHVAATGPFLALGMAVLTVEWPLHGMRRSVKLSERLMAALETSEPDPNGQNLVTHFARQALSELSRAIDAASGIVPVDAKRVGLAASGDAARLAALLPAVDQRFGRAALALTRTRASHWPSPSASAATAHDHGASLLLLVGDGIDDLEAESLPKSVEVEPLTGSVAPISAPVAERMAAYIGA